MKNSPSPGALQDKYVLGSLVSGAIYDMLPPRKERAVQPDPSRLGDRAGAA